MHKLPRVSLVLENVRSAHNVGAAFRTADASGAEKLYLVGITPAPVDRFGRERSDIAKVALGAERLVPWEQAERLDTLIDQLKQDGYFIVALEQHKDSVDYRAIKAAPKTALIVGNEPEGLSEAVLKRCDAIMEIPMRGRKESLNASIALGIALYTLLP